MLLMNSYGKLQKSVHFILVSQVIMAAEERKEEEEHAEEEWEGRSSLNTANWVHVGEPAHVGWLCLPTKEDHSPRSRLMEWIVGPVEGHQGFSWLNDNGVQVQCPSASLFRLLLSD